MDHRDCQRRRLVEWLVAEITCATGRRCSIKLEALDDESLRELQRPARAAGNCGRRQGLRPRG
jgi:hypothetical protein